MSSAAPKAFAEAASAITSSAAPAPVFASEVRRDPFAATFGSERGTGAPARTFTWQTDDKTCTVTSEDDGLITLAYSARENFFPGTESTQENFCEALWKAPHQASFYLSGGGLATIDGERLTALREWMALTITAQAPLLGAGRRLLAYASAHAAHGADVATANNEYEVASKQARARAKELDHTWKQMKAARDSASASPDSAKSVVVTMSDAPSQSQPEAVVGTQARVLCSMCGSTTRTRCGRLGCA